MLPDPDICWRGVPSMIDGIRYPNVDVIGASLLNKVPVRCLVSEWSAGDCLRVYSVDFPGARVVFAVEEMLYSIINHDDGTGNYDGGVYLKETDRSAVLARLAEDDPMQRRFRHFLLVGLNTCVEIVDTHEPIVRTHADYESARRWAREAE
ncbi:hypothetical protein EIB18_09180 [Caulobacter vibrioides]|uniref:Uncharacterized protein n=2 Tax=Caulobacter vibrioides TaxID=155892 RepID=Q9A7J5_CAUVC|nr:hypothetical protein [Caulobacter vibrioides]YP_002517174.1 hypothetical protein CCNA_01801 [Caulobacter vibrioides NA1000]AAK23704.1 hypothetical protein CC_1728 [Caulobacter vibrioides CB15]ACL95266.1 hypothetical protein CCNA_01801 [Caulobacter vibrioides NA1000]ATC28606.1 hypothetical protein CA607_09540 [Caulobacter vibrioides]AZH12864.1 hypothetical protein EIB18_09180 [Caulobacter vibrioides]QXZ53786.1 hypothetical protein KZH45_09010 [Caulobacter vibrioides]